MRHRLQLLAIAIGIAVVLSVSVNPGQLVYAEVKGVPPRGTAGTLFFVVSLPLFVASLAYCDKKVLPDFRWERTVSVAAILVLVPIVLGLVLAVF
jgi:hypothetical protein